MLANYTPGKWWECDIFEITDAGYFREYEVKVSRGDFLADAKKAREIWGSTARWTPGAKPTLENKHSLLAARCDRAPVQFWFCVSKGLVTLAEVPEWAGLIEVEEINGEDWRTSQRVTYHRVNETKKAPRLHSAKLEGSRREHARWICYWRMHHVLRTSELCGPSYWPENLQHGEGI
jgi:hypothetical protein